MTATSVTIAIDARINVPMSLVVFQVERFTNQRPPQRSYTETECNDNCDDHDDAINVHVCDP
jgi:hypothetical protein